MKKGLLVIGMLFCWCVWLQAGVVKSNLKVLYVGGSADVETAGKKVSPDVLKKSVDARMASFEQFLNTYFTTVKMVKGEDYAVEMSDDYDVTVFDGRPQVLVPEKYEKDADGNVVGYARAAYLPETFDRPAVTIASMGEILGRSIGLKTDWYCLCLDADAHHFRAEHPIFHGPFDVTMTLKMKPTPTDAYHYAYYVEGAIPDSLPMWQVQTKGYMTDEGFRVGMVARPWGFEDSPDAEYISSGVCAKTLDAVAIGRHGNFLHWGFAASPQYMTEEAKVVLANAIAYISEFAGQTPIARKYNDRIATREYLKELKYLSTRAAWQERLKSDEEWNREMLRAKKEAQDKQASGEELEVDEKQLLDFEPQKPQSYADFIKRYQKKAFDMFGEDEQAYQKYYDENRDYFYGGEGMYVLTVDEDAKGWGIANNDVRLLEKAVSQWEKGLEVEKARRVLERYTLCRFETPEEWRAWLEANKERLFFTESGGWLFMVNTRDKNVPGNDYRVKDQKKETRGTEAMKLETNDKNPIAMAVQVKDAGNGNKVVEVYMKIHAGYHIYASVAQSDAFIPTTVEIALPAGYEKIGDLKRSSFRGYNDAGTTVFEDKAVFTQEIKGAGKGVVKCIIGYQCCDAHICFPPVEKVIEVVI